MPTLEGEPPKASDWMGASHAPPGSMGTPAAQVGPRRMKRNFAPG